MPRRAAAPFHLRRSSDEMSGVSYTSTTETVHGLVRLDGDRLVMQWRVARRTEHMGAASISSDEEVDDVREVVIPLHGVAGAAVQRSRWTPWRGPTLVLHAADLRAFDEVAGSEGLKLAHPAELRLRLRRTDALTAEEFAAELELALAERAMSDGAAELEPGSEAQALPPADDG